jgi:fatty acid desaturase
LFAAEHELNHYTAFKTRWPNDFFNRITGFLQLYPRDYERWYHFEHHRHPRNWKREPELLSRGGPYTLASYFPYLFGITYWTERIERLFSVTAGNAANYYTVSEKRKVVVEWRVHLGAYGTVALLSIVTGSWFAVTYWLAPLSPTKAFQNVQNIAEHTGLTRETDTIHNTRTVKDR